MSHDVLFNPQSFSFDCVYDQETTQDVVYENTAKSIILSSLQGYNATILAYGPTGTGKTYTMEGFQYSGCHPERGIVPRALEDIFEYIESYSNDRVRVLSKY